MQSQMLSEIQNIQKSCFQELASKGMKYIKQMELNNRPFQNSVILSQIIQQWIDEVKFYLNKNQVKDLEFQFNWNQISTQQVSLLGLSFLNNQQTNIKKRGQRLVCQKVQIERLTNDNQYLFCTNNTKIQNMGGALIIERNNTFFIIGLYFGSRILQLEGGIGILLTTELKLKFPEAFLSSYFKPEKQLLLTTALFCLKNKDEQYYQISAKFIAKIKNKKYLAILWNNEFFSLDKINIYVILNRLIQSNISKTQKISIQIKEQEQMIHIYKQSPDSHIVFIDISKSQIKVQGFQIKQDWEITDKQEQVYLMKFQYQHQSQLEKTLEVQAFINRLIKVKGITNNNNNKQLQYECQRNQNYRNAALFIIQQGKYVLIGLHQRTQSQNQNQRHYARLFTSDIKQKLQWRQKLLNQSMKHINIGKHTKQQKDLEVNRKEQIEQTQNKFNFAKKESYNVQQKK